MPAILIAGIGNVFDGDDGFGVAVARELTNRKLPERVQVTDFGIRGLDLVHALLEGYDAAILVDCMLYGVPPGTVSVIEPVLPDADSECESLALSPHAMDPVNVLRLAQALGAPRRHILLVVCEPASFGDGDTGSMELSPVVAAAVAPAADAIQQLVQQMSQELLKQEVA